MKTKWNVTVWKGVITDSGKDEYTNRDVSGCSYKFRLLDDDGEVYAYGMANKVTFDPLDEYLHVYGCTEIQYLNPETKEYETL